jgi:hypothetical protein
LASIFPIFRPAGESYPDRVVPIAIEDLVHRLVGGADWALIQDMQKVKSANKQSIASKCTSKDVSNGTVSNDTSMPCTPVVDVSANGYTTTSTTSGNKSTEIIEERRLKQLYDNAVKVVRSLFECIGVLLGFAIRNECVLGIGFPEYIWKSIIGSNIEVHNNNRNHAGKRGNKTQSKVITWQELCGQDEMMQRNCQYILNIETEKELSDLSLTFTGSKVVWNENTEISESGNRNYSANFVHCDLLPHGSDINVTKQNRFQYVNKLCRMRHLTPGQFIN